MSEWSAAELGALKRAYASGTLRVTYDGKTVEYDSAEGLMKRIRTIERDLVAHSRHRPLAGFASFSRGDR